MKTLTEKATLFNTAISEQIYKKNEKYRFFTFVTHIEYKNIILLINTLSRQLIFLTKEEYAETENNIKGEIFERLVKDYFLVPQAHDDLKLKNQFLSLIPLFDTKKGITSYTVLPTTECNARCFYCYERGAEKSSMGDQTANDVADYIIEKSLNQKVSIQWFGGEPLYNQAPINIITDRLRSAGCEFKSKMISNGYLFDDTTVKAAKEKWNLKTVQITLDGTEEIYNRCKAYIYKNDESPFLRVLGNIERLLKSGISVTVRLNMDNHNKEDLYKLIDILAERFSEYSSLLSVYTFLLFDNFNLSNSVRDYDDRKILTTEQIKIEDYIEEKGLFSKTTPSKDLQTSYCMADNDHATTVLPDGHLGKCEHYIDSGFWGSIYSDNKDSGILSEWKIKREPVELCASCPIAPQCNRLKNCPDDNTHGCDEYVQAHKLSKLHRQMKNAYDKYLSETGID